MSKSVFTAVGSLFLTIAIMRMDNVQAKLLLAAVLFAVLQDCSRSLSLSRLDLDSLSDGDLIDSALDFVYGNERTVYDSFLGKVQIRTVYTNQQRFMFVAGAVAIVLGLLGVLCYCLVAANSSADPPPTPVYIERFERYLRIGRCG